eukprot:1022501-Prymnesium_polylepis.1
MLTLKVGYWRHSTVTLQTHSCPIAEGWTPCRGGIDAGHEGDGYCAPGHRGLRCEVCDAPTHAKYFD